MYRAWKCPLAAAVLAVSIVPSANAAFSSLVVFGDSLSDNGNAAALTGNFFPPAAYYYPGHFSNGPVAAEYLQTLLGATLHDFAVGGATTGTRNYNYEIDYPAGVSGYAGLGISGMWNQVAGFSPAGYDMPHTLFTLWGGANDIFLEASKPVPDFGGAITNAVSNLATEVGVLAAMGATNFLVPNIPDLGKSPEAIAMGPAAQATLSTLSGLFNGGLSTALTSLRSALGPGAHLYGFPTDSFMNGVIAGSPLNGFTNVTTGCLPDSAAPLCAGYLFYDSVHPTTAAHSQLGGAFAAAVPEPETWSLMLGGLAAIGALLRRRAAGAG